MHPLQVCAEPPAIGHGPQPARLPGDVIGPQGGDRVEVPPAGAGRVDPRQQPLPVAATAPAALEADRGGQLLGQPEEPGQPDHHAEPGQARPVVVADAVSQGGSTVGGQGQGGLQRIEMHPKVKSANTPRTV